MYDFEKLTDRNLNLKDNTLDENGLASSCPLDNGHISNTPEKSLGLLDTLPLELLQLMLAQLDLRTLTDFRSTNRRALQIVDNIPQYKTIVHHIPNTLRGILSIETGRWITCETLYHTFCTAECDGCGDFGGYLYILTCKRVCFLCLSSDQAYLPLPYGLAARKFGLTYRILNTLPHMKSIPGIYSPNERKCRKRFRLVDYDSAYQAGANLHGSSSAMERYVSDLAAQKLQDYNRKILQGINARRPPTEDPFDGSSGNPLRFMAIVQAPAFNRSTQEVEFGSYCVGCQRSTYGRPQHFRRRFTRATFPEHLNECGAIQNGEHQVG